MRAALLALASTGCAAIGARTFTRTKTYTYETPVTVEVRSEPEGATIVDDKGVVLGTAPATITTRHTALRTRRSRSSRGIALGCVADLALAGVAMYTWAGGVTNTIDDGTPFGRLETDVFSSWRQRLLLLSVFVAGVDCATAAFSRWGVSREESDTRDSLQVHQRAFDRDVTTDRAQPRTITLEARWRDWSPIKATIEIPTHNFLTLRRGQAGTFDDALVRHVRAAGTLDAEGMYRAGLAFSKMARETKVPEHATQAIGLFERYLATDDVPDARRAELAPLIATLRGIR